MADGTILREIVARMIRIVSPGVIVLVARPAIGGRTAVALGMALNTGQDEMCPGQWELGL